MFHFKRFSIDDSNCGMKVGTDAVILGAWTEVCEAKNIIDAGSGSGIISLMMAQRTSDAQIKAIEIDDNACRDARNNVANSPWKSRIEVINADVIEFPMKHTSPLLVISNPPFYSETLRSPEQSRALARHDDEFGVGSLIKLAGKFLSFQHDSLAFIAPSERDEEIEFLLSLSRLSPYRITHVYSKKCRRAIRTLWQAGCDKFNYSCESTDLYICDQNGMYTDEYMRLTSEFYLDK